MAWARGPDRLAAGKGRDFSRGSLPFGAVLAVALALLPGGEAGAACAPASGNDVTAICTDSTINQGGGAPGTSAGSDGYGTGTETNLTTSVVPGASVMGTNSGISFHSGIVQNSGTISGGTIGIRTVAAATVSNSGTISGGVEGIFAFTTATVSNSGTIISGGLYGIRAMLAATVSNSGTISGGVYGIETRPANVSNSGTISGGTIGIRALTAATVSNSGTISGGVEGIFAFTTATVSNSGTISGGVYGIETRTANVSNSGIISGGTAALQFDGNRDTLTLLPGSTIIGAINLGGGGDTVNFRTGNQNLTFDTLADATVTSTVPFVVSGNRVVTIDPTPFAMTDRNLLDFTRSVSSILGDRFGGMGLGATGPTPGFENESDVNTPLAGDFDNIPGLSAYASDGAVFKNPTVQYSDGTAVWGRGFAGQRVQQADDPLLHTLNQFYGGMIGGDWQRQSNLRIGAFIGGGKTRSSEDINMGNTDSDIFFGGLFGHYNWSVSFLGVALEGGHTHTDTTRNNINNNLVAGGLETAKASYGGWYITPEATYGLHYGLGSLMGASYTLTPSLNLRYLYASFGGYTESGTTAPLTVRSQTVSDLEERGQLKLTRTQMFASTNAIMTSLYGGVLGVQRAGSNTVDATLLGQAIPFATPGKDDAWGGYGGGGLEIRTGDVTVFASAEYLTFSDSSSVVSGQGGIRISF